jgi:hypothetical protein
MTPTERKKRTPDMQEPTYVQTRRWKGHDVWEQGRLSVDED